MENVWEAIIGNPALDETDNAISTILNDLEIRQKDLEYQAEADASGELLMRLKSDTTTAGELIVTTFKFFSYYPQFYPKDDAFLSADILVKERNPFLVQAFIATSILVPNLYSVLLLEADIRQKDMEEPLPLYTFLMKKDIKVDDYPPMAHALASPAFLPQLKALLGVRSRTGNERHQICTNFPNLLIGIIKFFNISPLSKNAKTANSYIYNIKFYKGCFSQIAPEGIWTVKSFEEYYILERIFRIETKLSLFDILRKENIEKNRDVSFSHKLLADFFFSSPLAILPKSIYQSLFQNGFDRIRSKDEKIRIQQSLHFLIQLSTVWFQPMLRIMRTYMVLHNIRTYQDVKDFLFSGPDYFKSFSGTYMPTTGKRNTDLGTRALKDEYSNEWNDFTPLGGYCSEAMKWASLRDWAEKRCPDSYSLAEQYALEHIQDTLQLDE